MSQPFFMMHDIVEKNGKTIVYPADEDGNKSAYGYSAGRVSHAAALKKMGFKALNCDNSYHNNSQS